MRSLFPTRKVAYAFLCWGIAPNLPFLILSINFSFLRYKYILFYFVLFLSATVQFKSIRARRILLFFVFVADVVVFGIDGMLFASKFFGLLFFELVASIPQLFELNLFSFLPYVFIGVVFLFSAGAVPAFAWKIGPISVGDRAYACVGLVALMALDVGINASPFHAGDWVVASLQTKQRSGFESALGKSGLVGASLYSEERKLLIVVVEALGQFRDGRINEAIFSSFDDQAISRRYLVAGGSVAYSGATTAAELRELCNTRASYLDILDAAFDPMDCLPNRLSRRGFGSVAFHAFHGGFFDRDLWYPAIGFEDSLFLEQLGANDVNNLCGGTLKGFCDRLIGEEIKRRLEGGDDPKLYYWLTLNSHFPAKRTPGFGAGFDCEGFRLPDQVCVMTEYWAEVMAAVAAIAKSPSIRLLDILVVGDHGPPLIYRSSRRLFRENLVPFIKLSAKGG